jgi:sugar phosphate isomerase/epimerase
VAEFIASTYTYLWRDGIDVAFVGIAGAGFDRAELLAAPPHVDAGERRVAADRIGAVCRRAGVRVHSVVPSGVDVNLVENTPTGILDTGEECARLVERVGPDLLGVCYDVANRHMVEDVDSPRIWRLSGRPVGGEDRGRDRSLDPRAGL